MCSAAGPAPFSPGSTAAALRRSALSQRRERLGRLFIFGCGDCAAIFDLIRDVSSATRVRRALPGRTRRSDAGGRGCVSPGAPWCCWSRGDRRRRSRSACKRGHAEPTHSLHGDHERSAPGRRWHGHRGSCVVSVPNDPAAAGDGFSAVASNPRRRARSMRMRRAASGAGRAARSRRAGMPRAGGPSLDSLVWPALGWHRAG